MPLGRAGLSPHPLGVAYSPKCVEEEFCEVRGYKITHAANRLVDTTWAKPRVPYPERDDRHKSYLI
jgi:hypothetical protein